MLPKADANGAGWTDQQIAEVFDRRSTVFGDFWTNFACLPATNFPLPATKTLSHLRCSRAHSVHARGFALLGVEPYPTICQAVVSRCTADHATSASDAKCCKIFYRELRLEQPSVRVSAFGNGQKRAAELTGGDREESAALLLVFRAVDEFEKVAGVSWVSASAVGRDVRAERRWHRWDVRLDMRSCPTANLCG
ncbi:MAG: hypothetical protein KatS3mg110_1961 [Pirellulaceae bacterium]|nr:MAG: hypothetical protein KatS3mg110_1961 [Pirellulaceae bacterium]